MGQVLWQSNRRGKIHDMDWVDRPPGEPNTTIEGHAYVQMCNEKKLFVKFWWDKDGNPVDGDYHGLFSVGDGGEVISELWYEPGSPLHDIALNEGAPDSMFCSHCFPNMGKDAT